MSKKNTVNSQGDEREQNQADTQISPNSPNLLSDAEAMAEQYLAGWQRAQADLVNFRKRAEEEKAAFIKFAHADLLMQILPVLDNFKRAAQHTPDSSNESNWANWANGVKAIEKHFEQVLQANGITEVLAKVGEPFDPMHHEAIASEESDQAQDTILAVIEPGYLLNGKLLRPAKVKVAK